MISRGLAYFVAFALFFGGISIGHGAVTYTPGAKISMTGSNGDVYFDVTDDIVDAGTTVGGPSLYTASRTFSGAFYLSGAGWVDFSTGAYQVTLDCGSQSLGALTSACRLMGTGYAELIGDVVFGGAVTYQPSTGRLAGSVSTWIGTYSLDGIALPLRPAEFVSGDSARADHAASLSISGTYLYSGIGAWRLYVRPTLGVDASYILPSPVDLSHASGYRVEIIDPDGGRTVRDYSVTPSTPSTSLDASIATTVRQTFCTAHSSDSRCPDGDTISPTRLTQAPTGPVVANGVDTYDFTLFVRDRYGNQVDDGEIQVEYRDDIRTLQVDTLAYQNITDGCIFMSGCAVLLSGDMIPFNDGTPSTIYLPLTSGDITYSFASIAPTSMMDTLTLSGVLYRDSLGNITDITLPAWKSSLTFTPWYTTSLSATLPIVVGDTVDFGTNFTHTTTAPLPTSPTAIYDIRIGDNTLASFRDFTSSDTISCTKYTFAVGSAECNWFGLPDPAIISTDTLSFSGRYHYDGYDIPPPETVSYTSYIRYTVGGTTVLYPSGGASFGPAIPGDIPMKVIGQQNISKITGINIQNDTQIFNILKKNTAILSRNRTSYDDTDYVISMHDITASGAAFTAGVYPKRSIIAVGGDITITHNLTGATRPIALIALVGTDGQGGHITIDPSVTDIEASLFAERAVYSSGSHQLYIRGNFLSRNTLSDTDCPYFVSTCTHPEKYNLQNFRRDYLDTPGMTSSLLGGKYSPIPFIIEYDGRILRDPPPALAP